LNGTGRTAKRGLIDRFLAGLLPQGVEALRQPALTPGGRVAVNSAGYSSLIEGFECAQEDGLGRFGRAALYFGAAGLQLRFEHAAAGAVARAAGFVLPDAFL